MIERVHHFEEIIGGRTFHIEVMPVHDRWRAQIRRGRGMPTALMPFYGATPNAAAEGLRDWLLRAHEWSGPPVRQSA